MNIDVTQIITDLDGNPVKAAVGSDEPVILRTILTNAILMPRQSDAQVSGAEKITRFKLAQRIHDNVTVDLAAEEVVKIKDLVSDTYPTLIVAKVFQAIDPAS